jgi:hypothetical protein
MLLVDCIDEMVSSQLLPQLRWGEMNTVVLTTPSFAARNPPLLRKERKWDPSLLRTCNPLLFGFGISNPEEHETIDGSGREYIRYVEVSFSGRKGGGPKSKH